MSILDTNTVMPSNLINAKPSEIAYVQSTMAGESL